MGNIPTPEKSDDEKEKEKCDGTESTTTNSATVVILGLPQPELVADPDIASTLLAGLGANARGSRAASSGSGGPSNNYPGRVPPFFGGGGGGGGPPPDDVAESFRLDAIGGLTEQIQYLRRQVILPWVRPEFFAEWGVKPPKGILLHGPPGTGKTFMAKALVNEIKRETGEKVNFFYRKGGDVFSMWFGESQRKLREVFDTAKAAAPAVIFFDEIDGLCPSRDRPNQGTEAYSSVVTCFLGQMDALENGKVFVIGATNRLEAIDPAVRRPGRFDKHLAFGFPDEEGRAKIIGIHTRKWDPNDQPSERLVKILVQKTIGFSGADLEKLCKDAVYVAMEENNGTITDDMQLTDSHWLRAINGMQRTSTSSFGSYVISPTRPSDLVCTLVQPIVEATVGKIRPFTLPTSSTSSTLRKSFLICNVSHVQSKNFLNAQILQGILSDPLFDKMTLFDLSLETISNKILNGKPSVLAVFHEVLNQALDTESPSVVIIPNINDVMHMCEESGIANLVLSVLFKIHGPNIMLLATSSEPLGYLRGKRFLELFAGMGRTVDVENPRAAQLVQFFGNVFDTSGSRGSREKTKRFMTVARKASELSDNDKFEDILNLYSALSTIISNEEQHGDQVWDALNNVLNVYSRSKLR